MRRKDRDIISDALWVAYERGREGSGLGAGEPRDLVQALDKAGFEIVRKPQAAPEAVAEAVRLGNWVGVSLQDIQKWTAACRAGLLSRDAVIRALGRNPIDVDREIAEERQRARTLGIPNPTDFPGILGAMETPWPLDGLAEPVKLEPGRLEEFPAGMKLEPGKCSVVVLDEAGERKLQDLLAGKSVPTGRIVEVTYRMRDGSTRTQRHAEFGAIDKVSYDPVPQVGAKIAGATVLRATQTPRKLEPRAGAVRDLIEANRLIAEATEVLGHDAVDEILNNLADPVTGEAA